MTQEDINAMHGYAEFLYSISGEFDYKAKCYMGLARQEQRRLDSLVHFCQTGKFLDEQPANKKLY